MKQFGSETVTALVEVGRSVEFEKSNRWYRQRRGLGRWWRERKDKIDTKDLEKESVQSFIEHLCLCVTHLKGIGHELQPKASAFSTSLDSLGYNISDLCKCFVQPFLRDLSSWYIRILAIGWWWGWTVQGRNTLQFPEKLDELLRRSRSAVRIRLSDMIRIGYNW